MWNWEQGIYLSCERVVKIVSDSKQSIYNGFLAIKYLTGDNIISTG